MSEPSESDYSKQTSWRRLVVFSLIFIAMTAVGLYAVYDQFAERSLTFDPRLIAPTTLLMVGLLLLVYFVSDACGCISPCAPWGTGCRSK
ncbi:hypothetical protein [Marinobacter similis]|uniref:hypothetical protein n=1 Tax=Marinobacter similis TaxID=1420916 RepID=UPI000A7BC9D8|nr:hypothetical protein [Marinobacter similis]